MNREQRRKSGISKEQADKLEQLNKPCTVVEVVQLAQGVADDKIQVYHNNVNPIIVSLSIQLEVLKDMLFSSGIVDEEEFIKKFNDRVEDFNRSKEEVMKSIEQEIKSGNNGEPATVVTPGDIELTVVK